MNVLFYSYGCCCVTLDFMPVMQNNPLVSYAMLVFTRRWQWYMRNNWHSFTSLVKPSQIPIQTRQNAKQLNKTTKHMIMSIWAQNFKHCPIHSHVLCSKPKSPHKRHKKANEYDYKETLNKLYHKAQIMWAFKHTNATQTDLYSNCMVAIWISISYRF